MKLLVITLLISLSAPAFAAEVAKAITIGFNPAEKAEVIELNGKRLTDYVAKKTKIALKPFVAKDYDDLVDALATGKVDFAFFSPVNFVRAEELAHARLLLKAVRKGKSTSYSAIIVRADSGIQKLEDLKDKTIAWVDPASTTGFLIPATELRQREMDPDTLFKKQIFLGAHDKLVDAVFKKTVDAGATWADDPQGKYGSWHRYLQKTSDSDQIKMIFASQPIPGDALVTTEQFWKTKESTAKKLVKAIQRMGDGLEGQQILRDLYGIDKMVPAAAKDFDSIRAAIKYERSKAH